MSYHARIGKPLLIVTGRTGACGNTKRTDSVSGSRISSTIGTKSLPSAPRPCSHTTDASGRAPVSSSTPGKGDVIAVQIGGRGVIVAATFVVLSNTALF